MPKDELRKYRKKHRFAFEFRYPPLVQAFDRRGKILETIHSEFSKKLEHWEVKNVAINLRNKLAEKPTKQIFIDHHRALIVYENDEIEVGLDEFYKDSKKLLSSFFIIFPDNIKNINRVGVRLISIFETRKFKDYKDTIRNIKETFFKDKFPLSEKVNDFHISFKHDYGNIIIGPVCKGDDWIVNSFSDIESGNIPQYGLAIDVDSYLENIVPSELEHVFMDVFNTSVAVEKEYVINIIE